MKTRRDRAKRAATVLAVATLLLLGVFVGVQLPPPNAPAITVAGCEVTEGESNPTEPQSTTQLAAPARRTETSGKAAESESEPSVVLRVLDEGGEPIPYLTLTVTYLKDGKSNTADETTNEHGVVILDTELETAVSISIPRGYLLRQSAGGVVVSDDASEVRFNVAAENTLFLSRAAVVVLDVQYEDGRPYEGKVFVNTDGRPAGTVLLDGQKPVSIIWPTPSSVIQITAKSRRPGFESCTGSYAPEQTGSGGLWRIKAILKSAQASQGNIAIDLTQFSATEMFMYAAVTADVADWKRRSKGEEEIEGGRVFWTEMLEPGRYTVTVVGGERGNEWYVSRVSYYGYRYQTEVVVSAGTTSVVVPARIFTGSVELRVMDQSGAPISKAAVTISNKNMISWRNLQRRKPGEGRTGIMPLSLSDDDGVVILHGLEPNATELHVSAEGYESTTISVVPITEQLVSAGTVYLARATGSIVVTVSREDGKEQPSYTVLVMETGGGVLIPKRSFVGNEIVLEGLEWGKYTVSVLADGGEKVSSAQNVVLNSQNPSAELKFIVRTE